MFVNCKIVKNIIFKFVCKFEIVNNVFYFILNPKKKKKFFIIPEMNRE
jgi:hypothetical protein